MPDRTPAVLRRAAVGAVALAAVASGQAVAASGADAAPARTQVTVHASDTSVRPGEQLVLHGRLSRGAAALQGSVQVWSRTSGSWYRLTGARVHTTRTGAYRVRVVLSSTGDRQLKVVADPDAAGLGNVAASTRVTVR